MKTEELIRALAMDSTLPPSPQRTVRRVRRNPDRRIVTLHSKTICKLENIRPRI